MVGFPALPDLPGVPAIGRLIGAHLPLPVSIIADAIGLGGLLFAPRWGIFDDSGNPVLVGDAVHSVEFGADWRVSDFPIERGSFASYNKVEQPFGVKVAFQIGGLETDRTQFLVKVQEACDSLQLYNVVTPEVTYIGVNLIHHAYDRSAERGAANLRVEIWCQEIRVAASAAFTHTQLPAGADPIDQGQLQAAPPTPEQAAAVPTEPLSTGGDPTQSVAPAAIDVSGAAPGNGLQPATGAPVVDYYNAAGVKMGLIDTGFTSTVGSPIFDVNGVQIGGLGYVAR